GAAGIGPDRPLAIMCRNHRGFVEAMLGGSRLGADLLLLNTEVPAPQLGKVLERERPGAVVCDQEFAEAFGAAGFDGEQVLAWHEGSTSGPTLARFVEPAPAQAPRPPRRGRVVILTSGTTGTPKAAPREPSLRALMGPMTTLVSKTPL